MTDLVTPSPEELSSRRRALKKQRRLRYLQSIWRFLAITGLTGGVFWLLYNPFWLVLRSSNQVTVEGNQMLTEAAVRDLLPLQYPQPLLEVEPEKMVESLEAQSPIAYAQVSRQLFPPRLEIILQERQPVAVTVPSRPATTATAPKTPSTYPGLLDTEGYWMAQDPAEITAPDFELPTLQVRGYQPQYQPQWPDLYKTLQNSTVKVTEVDWRIPSNLILKTELGTVHLGIYDPLQIQEQLATLTQLRSLKSNPNVPSIEYIDLSDPTVPSVNLTQPPPAKPAPETP